MDEYWIYGPYVLENSYFPHVWDFINTYYKWNDYIYIATLVPILLLAGTFVVRKSGWTKWVMIGLATLFSIFTLYTTIKINSIENEAKEWEEINREYNGEYDYYY